MIDKSQAWVKAQNTRTLTLMQECKTMRPSCLGNKPREMKTQKGTNTDLHNNFIHSNQKWKTAQISNTGKHTVVCTCNRYYLAKQMKGNYCCISHGEISKTSYWLKEAKQSTLKSPSAWDSTAAKLTSGYRIQTRDCFGVGAGEKEADRKGAGGTLQGYKTPIFWVWWLTNVTYWSVNLNRYILGQGLKLYPRLFGTSYNSPT